MIIDVYTWTDSRMKTVPPGDGEWVLEDSHLAAIAEKDAEIDELQAKCDQMEGDAHAMAKWIVRRGQNMPDRACPKCMVSGELVIPDWLCAYHMAVALTEPTK
jgi:hypothetical protein